MGKKLEDYLGTDPAQLMALIAFKVDDMSDDKLPAITAHLKQLNDSVATNARNITKNDRRLCKSEARAELEDRYGLVKLPMNKKKMIALGGGGLALVAAVLYLLPPAIDWLKSLL
jgi:hypothetical protein